MPAPRLVFGSPTGILIFQLAADVARADGVSVIDTLTDYPQYATLRGWLLEFAQGRAEWWITSVPPSELLRWEEVVLHSALPPLVSVTRFALADCRHNQQNLEELLAQLRELPGVVTARMLRRGRAPATWADEPKFSSQFAPRAAIRGIGAIPFWSALGAEGAGVQLAMVDESWNLSHEDIAPLAPTLLYGANATTPAASDGAFDHGTACLSLACASDNALGMIGIAPQVGSVFLCSRYQPSAPLPHDDVGNALAKCLQVLGAGDLVLLEYETSLIITIGGISYSIAAPAESDKEIFHVVRLLSALGIIVIEPAGNGNRDLSHSLIAATGLFAHDSGAVLVAAAEWDDATSVWRRAGLSNFHSTRIDCFAEGVDAFAAGNWSTQSSVTAFSNSAYDPKFGGTSAASAIIAGAAILLQSAYRSANGGTPMSPAAMRALLRNDLLGTHCSDSSSVGVMPNLAHLGARISTLSDLYLRDSLADDGAVPSPGATGASPDVIVKVKPPADPATAFGEGTRGDDSLSDTLVPGVDHSIYVRFLNRGKVAAGNARAAVYWSEASTLVRPDLWTLIGVTAPVSVPANDLLVVAPALAWPAAALPPSAHFCLVAVAGAKDDPAPAVIPQLPAPPLTWNEFLDLIENNNNVAWRNLNQDLGPAVPFPFWIRGWTDLDLSFTWLWERQLQAHHQVEWNVPAELAPWLEGRGFVPRPGACPRDRALLCAPESGCVDLGSWSPRPGPGYRVEMRILPAGKPLPPGSQLRLRQFWTPRQRHAPPLEVGRLTWRHQG